MIGVGMSDQHSTVGTLPSADAGIEIPTAAQATSPRIGKIERVPLREVWRHEAHNLTTWLEENIDVLNEVLDF
jgi:hypothetical protein